MVILKVICLLLLSFVNLKLRISKDSRLFTDEFGRTMIFHGVNVVYKVAPYIPIEEGFDPYLSLSLEDVKYMKKFGFNIVRFGVLWEAIETAPNVYNYELLDRIWKMINMLGENGIYTIVDAHQDIFSRVLCGEGVPIFYARQLQYEKDCNSSLFKKFMHLVSVCKGIKEYNYREDDNGIPLIEDCVKGNFMFYHTSPDLTSIYSQFYKNEKGILDKFILFWKVLANKFKSNQYVIGYDLWNEPWPGDFYNNISKWIPGRSDKEDLLPMYRKLDKEIREIDNDYVMMFEPTPFPDVLPVLGGIILGGFKEAPLPTQFNDRQVLNMHSYCCQASPTMCKNGEPPLESKETCRKHHFNKLKYMNNYGKEFNMSTILTEFGACKNSEACFNEITSVGDAADENLVSWTYWMYKPYKDFTTTCTEDAEGMFNLDGSVQKWKVKALARTYIQAFQGVPLRQRYDSNTKVFEAEFIPNPSINSPSELYFLQDLNYPKGYKLFLNSTEMYEIDDLTENILRFKILNSSTQNSFSSPRLVILSPKIEYNISLLNNSHFLSDDKLNYLESTEGLFDFEVNDIDSNNSVKNSILIIGAKSKSLKIESSVILNNVESHSFNMNSNEVHSFKDLNQHYLHKLVLRIKIDKLNYLIEIKNMLKHHIVITIK
jgi:endoglycosylceramidase